MGEDNQSNKTCVFVTLRENFYHPCACGESHNNSDNSLGVIFGCLIIGHRVGTILRTIYSEYQNVDAPIHARTRQSVDVWGRLGYKGK